MGVGAGGQRERGARTDPHQDDGRGRRAEQQQPAGGRRRLRGRLLRPADAGEDAAAERRRRDGVRLRALPAAQHAADGTQPREVARARPARVDVPAQFRRAGRREFPVEQRGEIRRPGGLRPELGQPRIRLVVQLELTRLRRRFRRRPRWGLSLVELLMAIFILGIGIISIAALFPVLQIVIEGGPPAAAATGGFAQRVLAGLDAVARSN